jgi:hypothetical protein
LISDRLREICGDFTSHAFRKLANSAIDKAFLKV